MIENVGYAVNTAQIQQAQLQTPTNVNFRGKKSAGNLERVPEKDTYEKKKGLSTGAKIGLTAAGLLAVGVAVDSLMFKGKYRNKLFDLFKKNVPQPTLPAPSGGASPFDDVAREAVETVTEQITKEPELVHAIPVIKPPKTPSAEILKQNAEDAVVILDQVGKQVDEVVGEVVEKVDDIATIMPDNLNPEQVLNPTRKNTGDFLHDLFKDLDLSYPPKTDDITQTGKVVQEATKQLESAPKPRINIADDIAEKIDDVTEKVDDIGENVLKHVDDAPKTTNILDDVAEKIDDTVDDAKRWIDDVPKSNTIAEEVEEHVDDFIPADGFASSLYDDADDYLRHSDDLFEQTDDFLSSSNLDDDLFSQADDYASDVFDDIGSGIDDAFDGFDLI